MPSSRNVHVNVPLTNISVAFMQSAEGFVARRVFPEVPVQKKSDRYYTFNRGDMNRDEMKERAPATESEGTTHRIDNTPNYYCRVYALHEDIDDEERANADSVLNPDRDATEILTHKGLIREEVSFANKYLSTGVWSQDYAGVASSPVAGTSVLQWNDANSTPIEDLRAEMTAQQLRSTFRPNTLLLGQQVFDSLIDHPDIVDRVKYGTQTQVSTVDIPELMALFKINRIMVMSGIYNTAQKGLVSGDEVNAFISGKVAWLGYAAPRPGLKVASGGYTFRWVGYTGSTNGVAVSKFDLRPTIKADRIEIESAWDQKVIAPDMGTLYTGVVA